MTLAELVEKVGRMMTYWQKHCLAWTDAEWLQRRKKLLDLLDAMDERLMAAGASKEQFGWTLASDCQWKRVGEPDPPPRISEEQLKAEFPEFYRAMKREAKEAAQPALQATGDTAGFTPW